MRKFLIMTSIFSLLVILSLGVGEMLVRSLENPYKIKDRAMTEAGGAPVRTIVLGDSHAYFGIRPDLLPARAVSLANVSQTLKYDLLLLRHYAPQLDSLKLVVMAVNYTSLFDPDLEDTSEWWRAINYKIYNHIDLHSDFSKYNAEISHISVYNKKLKSMAGIGEKMQESDAAGHGISYTLDAKNPDWESEGASIALRHDSGLKPETRNRNLQILNEIINFAKERNAQVIMVSTPEWPTYMQNLPRGKYAGIIATFDSVAKANGITYLNLTEDSRFGADDFYDPDHLTSDRGAAKLTRIITSHFALKP